jgi:hypothetical protein
MTIGPHARIETKRAAKVEIDDFRDWSVTPRFGLIGIEKLVVVPDKGPQAMTSWNLPGGILQSQMSELVIHARIEIMNQKMGPKVVQTLHQPRRFSGFSVVTLLQGLVVVGSIFFFCLVRSKTLWMLPLRSGNDICGGLSLVTAT